MAVVAQMLLSIDAKLPGIDLGNCPLSSHTGNFLSYSVVECTIPMCDLLCSMVAKLWALNDSDLLRLQRNVRAMLH